MMKTLCNPSQSVFVTTEFLAFSDTAKKSSKITDPVNANSWLRSIV